MTTTPTPTMSAPELPKSYTPATAEDQVRNRWEQARAFHADPRAPGEPFCIVIPPPNVTAALHLGHAFNNTLQDVLTRYHRMAGFNTLWMPGTDHAGIATQAVVEKRLLMQGKRRTDFSRSEFIAKVQEWKDEYEATIIEQLKLMGCSCDFERTRFTMDEVCAKAVREAFFRLFKDGLIYRGKRLVNWDPVTQTALADDEVEMEQVQGHMWYLRYPLENESSEPRASASGPAPSRSRLVEFITVATTRPETMLGDTAVAINPKDPRAADYIGKKVRLPIVDRVVPIIGDDFVARPPHYGGDPDDPKAAIATGFLKVTPAHDPNDYEIGQRHKLPLINVLAPDATISDKHGWTDISADARPFIGMTREDARDAIVKWFKDRGLLEDVKPYTHSVGHSYRSHVPIEPYLSDQWYVKVTDDRMRGEALRAMAVDQRKCASSLAGSAGVSPARPNNPFAGRGVTDELTIHRRSKLPHWQLGGSAYYITFNALNTAASFSNEERQVILNACFHWHGTRLHVHVATVMPDHVHLIITPLRRTDDLWWSLPDLIHSIKSFTSHEIQRRRSGSGELWQADYFDRIIRSESDFLEKWNYIIENPVRAKLVGRAEEYPFTRSASHESCAGGIRAGETPALPAEDAADGADRGDAELRFFPARYAKTFQSWHENLRDWCISRQLWWGHRIPVWGGTPLSGGTKTGTADFEDCLKRWEADDRITRVFRTHVPIEDETSNSYGVDPYRWQICVRNENDREVIEKLESCGYEQDPDVLDTWFSSGLWPISTMGWPAPEAFPDEIPEGSALLNTFNPSTVLFTAREIITLWVSRMVMFNRYFRDGKLPFRHVYIHAMIQDGHGQKMSKSLGNGVDPRDIIHSHGADALRFVMTKLATSTQDVRLPVDMVCPHCAHAFHPKEISTPTGGYRVADVHQTCPSCGKKMASGYGAASGLAKLSRETPLARNTSARFDEGRNFANKLYNVTRFALANLNGGAGILPAHELHGQNACAIGLSLVDRWIISRLHRTLHTVEDALADYQFNVYADAMYDFLWRDFCDWYVEAIKPTIRAKAAQQQVLRTVLNASMRLLHPIMPFVTESLWPQINGSGAAGLKGITLPPSELLATAAWPDIECSVEDKKAVATFERAQKLIDSIRSIRSERQVPPKKRIGLLAPLAVMDLIDEVGGVVQALALLESVKPAGAVKPQAAVPLAFEGSELLLVGLVEAIDVAAERSRLAKVIAEKDRAIEGFRQKLSNEGYLSKAPADKVEETRRLLARAEADRAAAVKALQSLG